ncbi:hypothetical protein A7U60_g7410 [Sanghuangporus baumii]|uniref:Zn(2)-C6 fungal-type domain-containing protein n=1 Tax=Sanghuangporus baumii TaxID=108892 RepID=A0A9Q5HT76_SANBA|nr:hypothetical protein A7U60_g7410 [Sanghuangporus baumii]
MPPSRNISRHKDSVEVRRARGEISCAECRRHKLKCNKSIPCGTCIRKGCEEVCPNGTLTLGQPPRHVPRDTDTDVQMKKLTQMSKRIQQLEDALQIANSSLTTSTHPLLSDELLKIKNVIEGPMHMKEETDASDEDTVNSIGTLRMLGRGVESYVGANKLLIDRAVDAMHLKVNPLASPAMTLPGETFPFTPLYLPADEMLAQIEGKLPSFERASALVEAYLENTTWLIRIVDREQIMEELIPQIYRRRQNAGNSGTGETQSTDPHALALLLAIFACGAVADLTLPPWNEEADLYYHLASTAIGLRSVFDGTSLHTVQALAVLGSYDIFSCRKNSLEGTWKLISFSDNTRADYSDWFASRPIPFQVSSKAGTTQKTAILGTLLSGYMEIHIESIGSGRPRSLNRDSIDCELPEDTDATVLRDGTKISSIWGLRHQFTKEIVSDLVDRLSSARALRYSEILLFDQKVRDFRSDEFVKLETNSRVRSDASGRELLERLMIVLLKEPTLLLLHRNFFLRALIENPSDPTRSHFAPSFFATYRCATMILRGLRGLMYECDHFITRIWPMWAHALSASVMLGSIAACGTRAALAPEAYIEFNHSIDMLAKVQIHPLVKDLLPTVLQLRDRAYDALVRHGNDVPKPRSPVVMRPPKIEEKSFDLLNSMDWMVPKRLQGHFGTHVTPHQSISNYLDEPMPGPDTPSASTSTSSRTLGGAYSGGVTHQQADLTSETSLDRIFNHDQTNTAQSTNPTLSDMMVSPQDSLLSQINTAQYASGTPRVSSTNQYGLYLPSEMQADYGQGTERPTSHNTNGQTLNHGVGILQSSQLSSSSRAEYHDSLPSASNAAFGVYPAGVDGGEHVQAEMDSTQSPLDFDSFPDFSLESFLNTDFDVSFDMRSSTGDENILPLISDDLEPCRTILQDSRFFGIGPNISTPGNETQFGGS